MDAHIKSRIVSAEEARTFMGLSWVLTGAHPLTSNAPTVDDLAATVIALTAERDRLREILACERGERAPEGWEWCLVRDEAWSDDFDDEGAWVWCRGRDTRIVRSAQTGRWMAWTLTPGLRNSWDGQAPKDHLPTALEAIEAADRAAKETK